MTTDGNLPQLLIIDQLVERLGTSTRHVRRLIAERRIPYLKVGRFVRFDPDEINRWLDDSRVVLRPPPPSLARPTKVRRFSQRRASDDVA